MRKFLDRWAAKLAHDSGVAGLVIAMVIAIVSATALAIFYRAHSGSALALAKVQDGNRAGVEARDAVMAYFIQNQTLPCPDTDYNGTANSPCTAASGTISGGIPWRTLNLSADAAVDPYGRYYKYILAAPATEQTICKSLALNFSLGSQFTGEMNPIESLEVLQTTAAAGTGSFVPFAIMSHGPNGYGGRPNGTATTISGATSFEATNAGANPGVIYSGPYNGSTSTPFDDSVYAPTTSKLQNVCEALSPGGAMNAQMGDDFNTAPISTDDDTPADGFSDTKWSTGGTAPTRTDGVARFAAAGYLTTVTSSEFSPAVRQVYVSAYWTPAANGNSFSIVTRATAGNTTNDGITFLFGGTSIDITNSEGIAVTAASLTVTAGKKYLLEVFDNGDDVWSRATQVDDSTNTATVRASNATDDLDGNNQVVFLNGTGTNDLDDVYISYPMLSLQTGASAYGTAAAANGVAAASSLTIEAWIRPTSSTASGSVVAQWDTAPAAANNSFRLYVSNGAVMLALNDTNDNNQSVSLGINLIANTWTHVAATFDATTHRVLAYENGDFVGSTLTSLVTGIHTPSETIGFGIDSVTGATPTPANPFTGQISDVRIWPAVRAGDEIATCFQRRLGAGTPCELASTTSNFTMDPSTIADGFNATGIPAAKGTAGSRAGGAIYTPAVALYFRPTSDTVCPSNKSGLYRCDFRTAGTFGGLTPPTTIQTIYAKAWGGGQNGAVGAGVGGAYAAGLFANAGTLSVTVGDNGLLGGDTVVVDGTAIITAPGGLSLSALLTILDLLVDILNSLLNISVTNNASNASDPDYNYVSATNPGRGGAAGLGNGNDGAAVLIW